AARAAAAGERARPAGRAATGPEALSPRPVRPWARAALPRWADIGLIPLANVLLAFLVAGLIVLLIGADPLTAVGILLNGALGSSEGLGYTLYYATNFVFTGLAVAVAFHAGLFNIGGEGQAYIGGLGVGLVLLG